ncbi:helix-turn-helix transcriptional regulator [Escherichia coli]|uniref:helix-turn-helix transcriptional regulator n=1 Tax=Escherichia coli TaxID=562 RepID=UPI000F86A4B1|nr:AlpA family phage regulatory protein [Escherichia coli]
MTDTSLIPEKEVMNKLGVSSRQTIWNYTKRHGFPKPVRTHPKSYLREAVEGWILKSLFKILCKCLSQK